MNPKGGRMKKTVKNSIVLCVVFSMVLIPFCVSAEDFNQNPFEKTEEISAGKIAFDAVVVRPVSFGAILAGSLLFVVALPVSAFTGETGTTYEKFIKDPARYTFKRPLGQFKLR
jgi:hypothetical protein